MNVDLTAAIVRILNPGHSTVGAGFLVSGDGLIATCAHVVRAAGAGPGDSVTIAFHAAGQERRTRVEPEWWRDPDAEDVAILRLEGPLPAGVTPVALSAAEGSAGHPFRAFGYPQVGDFRGVWGEGQILGQVMDERDASMLQLRAQEIAPGMSGAPVLDVKADRVVGMITLTYQSDATLKFRDAAFATSMDTLLQICPDLECALQAPVVPLGKLNNVPERLQRLAQRNLDSFSAKSGQISPQLHPRRAIQDELEDFLFGKNKGCILLIGGGGTGKSSLLYHLAKWAVESEIPLIYLNAGREQLQNTDWLAATLGCQVEDLPSFPDRYEQHFGTAPLVLLDTMDQMVGPKGIALNTLSLLLQWSESTRMICASRSSQAEKLCELLPLATVKVIPELTRAEIETVHKRTGGQFIRDERLYEIISTPLYLYLWSKTGAGLPDGQTSLWVAYWDEVIHGSLAAPRDWENFTEAELALAKMDLLDWLAQRMFQQGSYQVPQQITSKWLTEHVYGVAYDALIRAGTIFTDRRFGTAVIQFFHQSFFEFAVGRRILVLDHAEARHAIDQLIARVGEPFCRQIIGKFAYLAHQQRPDLEDYFYIELIARLGSSKTEMLEAQSEKRPSPPSASAVSWGIDYVLQDLVEHWGTRMCATLDSGSPDRPEDGEVASTIASVFEKKPRSFTVPSLIAGMRKYQKRGRFVGALGKIGGKEAKSALLRFTREQIACPTDKFVFRFLATALGEACGKEGIPLLRAIRDGDYDNIAKDNARRALQKLGQEEESGASPGYQPEHILAALSLVDEEGRPSDWRLVKDMADWLRSCGSEDQLVQANLVRIISALEAALDHMHDDARKPVAAALGELGTAQTFDLLSKRLAEGVEPSQSVVTEILSALVCLAEREQVDPAMTVGAIQARFSRIRPQYSALARVIRDVEPKILEHIRRSQ